MTRTLVAFHAHPDDEALLTAGTMARAAAEGHRVVLVLATDGGVGLAAADFRAGAGLGAVRLDEARASASALGVSRVEWLGYADSGSGAELLPDPPGRVRLCRARPEEAAERLAAVLRTERADVLLGYDAAGGYGHRDHVRVHEVGARAVAIAGTPLLLEATAPRDTLARGVRLAARLGRFPDDFDPTTFERAYTARADITHRIDVRRYAGAKRAAMRAHASQATADGGADRTLRAFLGVPRPLFDLVFGREWFRDPALPTGAPVRRDVFEGLP
ncbi:MAG TPA: PIG-L family deacetylase [Dermatophilaceae bacterium]|nr:PIG-L family deacetylase [Dermatophilaceae bacterium]